MIAALVYLQSRMLLNRLLMRFKRLKQPKYLIGAIVGALYFYFYFGRVIFWRFGRVGNSSTGTSGFSIDPALYEAVGALILVTIVLLRWIFKDERAALVFTEAEVAFLFPAPISRRGLIQYKLLRSQLGILFSVMFFTFLRSAIGTSGRVLIHAAGLWVIFATLSLHFIASSFALTKIMDRGISNWKRRLVIFALVLIAGSGVAWWTMREMPQLTITDVKNVASFQDYVRQAMLSGPLPYLLYPFRLAVRPYLAPDWFAFLKALLPALALMALHYVWVIRADVAFEEASVEASKKLADKIAAMRAGRMGATGKQIKRRRPPFKLHPIGPPFLALLWKNLISAGKVFTARMWIIVALSLILIMTSSGVFSSSETRPWLMIVGIMSASFAGWAALFGPQIMRQDFRQDLPQADLLKGYPMPGWQIAFGELLAPAVILTGLQWLLLIVAVTCAMSVREVDVPTGQLLAIAGGVAMLLPCLNLISLIIPNAAVLQFSSWFQTGKDAPQGIEATGQRLIFFFGQMLAFLVTLAPAAGVFVGIYFVVGFATNFELAMLLAAAATTLVLAVEVGLGVMLLGWLFNRFDLTAETTS
jgi:hypothetical protein